MGNEEERIEEVNAKYKTDATGTHGEADRGTPDIARALEIFES